MAVHLIRHGAAGDRHAGGDEARELTAKGLRHADSIAELLGDKPIREIRTSRYVRCAETIVPLAARLGLTVVEDDALAEEASIEATWALLETSLEVDGDVALCSHGNVLQALLDRLHRRGVELVATELSFRKGAVWTLEPDGVGGISSATLHLPRV